MASAIMLPDDVCSAAASFAMAIPVLAIKAYRMAFSGEPPVLAILKFLVRYYGPENLTQTAATPTEPLACASIRASYVNVP